MTDTEKVKKPRIAKTPEEKEKSLLDKVKLAQQKLNLAQQQLNKINTARQDVERRARTHDLIVLGAIFEMVNPDFRKCEKDSKIYKQLLGAAVQLNELIQSSDSDLQRRLQAIMTKADDYLKQKAEKEKAEKEDKKSKAKK